MSRYTGPKLRVVRRLGVLPGLTSKVPKKATRPGQHGALPKKKSQFGIALEEKQKIRYNYGLTERQLRRYHLLAKKNKLATGDVLLRICEMRLDSIVYRLGFAPSIPSARQMVRHGHIRVDGKRVTIPSLQCKPGNQILPSAKEGSLELLKTNLSKRVTINLPPHLSFNMEKLSGDVVSNCAPEDVMIKVDSRLVVEFYNK